MKANSKGLEVNVEISRDELSQIEHRHLDGILKFVDMDDGERDIPMSLGLGIAQKDLLSVRQYPFNDYFGRARDVAFLINDKFYEALKRQGACGDRFYGAEGKLSIEVRD